MGATSLRPVNPGIRMNTDPELFEVYLTLKTRATSTADEPTVRNLEQVLTELGVRGYSRAYVEAHAAEHAA